MEATSNEVDIPVKRRNAMITVWTLWYKWSDDSSINVYSSEEAAVKRAQQLVEEYADDFSIPKDTPWNEYGELIEWREEIRIEELEVQSGSPY